MLIDGMLVGGGVRCWCLDGLQQQPWMVGFLFCQLCLCIGVCVCVMCMCGVCVCVYPREGERYMYMCERKMI